ncbi:hypothetical protein ACWQV9_11315 [Brevundimonas diminuta]
MSISPKAAPLLAARFGGMASAPRRRENDGFTKRNLRAEHETTTVRPSPDHFSTLKAVR